jgi:hypothetical protein
MVDSVSSYIAEAELHNGRILKRLEAQDTTLEILHRALRASLLQAMRIASEIEDTLWHGETT